MDKQREYILNNWKAYDLTDTKEEFIALLNCLEANGETIDSLHDVALNGYDEFMGIFGRFENDRDVVEAVFEFAYFFTLEEFMEHLYEMKEEAEKASHDEGDNFYIEMFYEDYFTDNNPDCQITKTADGYVKTVRY